MRVYFRLLPYLKPYWRLGLVVFVCVLGSVAIGLLPPLITRHIVDDIIFIRPGSVQPTIEPTVKLPTESPIRQLFLYGGLLALVHIAIRFAGFLKMYLRVVVGNSVTHDFRNRVYRNLKTLPDGFFENRGTGDIMSRNSN